MTIWLYRPLKLEKFVGNEVLQGAVHMVATCSLCNILRAAWVAQLTTTRHRVGD